MSPGRRFLPKGLRNINDLSSFFQLGFNTWVFRWLPGWLSRSYLGALGRIYFHMDNNHRRSIQVSLATFAGARKGLPSPGRLWPRVRAGIIDHYHEKLTLGFSSYKKIKSHALERIEVRGGEHLEQALAAGRGVIMVTGHFGAVEFLPGALAFRGLPVTVMVHCKTPALRERLEGFAAQAGTMLLDPKAQATFFQAVDHLKRGRILMTQCDEISMWRPYPDRSLDFLGLRLRLDRSLDLLARKSGAAVVFGLVHRLGRGRYRLALEPIAVPGQGARGELVSQACLTRLSENIYANPAAWYEWKKLAQFIPTSSGAAVDEDSWLYGLPGRVAVPDSCRA